MNQLLDKFNEYKSISNYRIEYIFENDSGICFKLKQTDFPHLLGLHKLIDIPIIRQFNDKNNLVIGAKYINSKIKKQEFLTEYIIKRSAYFPDIEVRFNSFSKENILTMSYTDVIVDFNAALISSNLKSKYILFEKREQGYNHLCVAEDGNGKKYAESFFYNTTDLYIRNQKILKIKGVKIYDNFGALYLEDIFSGVRF
ncbi:MAG: PBECR4 domain-containing protein [Clostridiales bacterium]|nr:PBECR4 domain-containing protein [Clostridiales bacterium]